MGLFFRNRRKQTNSSDNNITINQPGSNRDIMFDIGKSLGKIENNTERINKKLNSVDFKLADHEKRLKKLESK